MEKNLPGIYKDEEGNIHIKQITAGMLRGIFETVKDTYSYVTTMECLLITLEDVNEDTKMCVLIKRGD